MTQHQWTDSATGQRLRLTDVSGQRSERKKWIPYFNDASAVVFVAAISEYDQTLAEEPSVNRLQDSLQSFQQLSSMSWLDSVPLVLLLNKLDLYEAKKQRVSIRVCFPKYRGGDDGDEGLEFIKQEFLRRVRGGAAGAAEERRVFVHVVSAVDRSAASLCMTQVKDIVRRRMQAQTGRRCSEIQTASLSVSVTRAGCRPARPEPSAAVCSCCLLPPLCPA